MVKKETVECKRCFGYGHWAIGTADPMGPMDFNGGGCPCQKCPACGSGRDDMKRGKRGMK